MWCTLRLSKFVFSLIRNIDVEDGWTLAALILKNLIPLAMMLLSLTVKNVFEIFCLEALALVVVDKYTTYLHLWQIKVLN